MNDLLLVCETRAEAYQVIVRSAQRLFTQSYGGLSMLEASEADRLNLIAHWGAPALLPETFGLMDCWALRRGEPYAVNDPARGAQCRHFSQPPVAPYLCLPLTVETQTIGLLHLGGLARDNLDEQCSLAITLRDLVKLTLANISAREALREQAIRDGLTGLYNRRYLDETLARELARARRRDEPLTVVMLDVDHFKRFNDSYGHEAGDAVLRAIGELLLHSVRVGDLACRYGGEEMTLVLPGAGQEDAYARLEALRQAIMQLHVRHEGGELPTITASFA